MADSPDQPQLKTHKWLTFVCELKNTHPMTMKNIGVT